MTVQELIDSATNRLRTLTEMEGTPLAELAQLELLLALARMHYEATWCEHNSPVSEPGDYECFS